MWPRIGRYQPRAGGVSCLARKRARVRPQGLAEIAADSEPSVHVPQLLHYPSAIAGPDHAGRPSTTPSLAPARPRRVRRVPLRLLPPGSFGWSRRRSVRQFWARMQVELLNRQRWKTRVELATAIHDYIEIWHNTRRRHSSLKMLTPAEFEDQHTTTTIAG